MTKLNYIIENLNGRLSCYLFSHNGPERPMEVALIMLVQGRSRSFLLLAHRFTFGKGNQVSKNSDTDSSMNHISPPTKGFNELVNARTGHIFPFTCFETNARK